VFLAKSWDIAPQLPYSFVLHHFGPYSFDLDRELMTLEAFNAVHVAQDPEGFGARYSVDPDYLPQLSVPSDSLRALSEWISDKTTRQLEAVATCQYFADRGRDGAVAEVQRVKPHLTEPEVLAAWGELTEQRARLADGSHSRG
jgi:hypothetical protein